MNICFLINKTCEDYFRAPPISPVNIKSNGTNTETLITNEPQLIDKTKKIGFYNDQQPGDDEQESEDDAIYNYEYENLLANTDESIFKDTNQKSNSSSTTLLFIFDNFKII